MKIRKSINSARGYFDDRTNAENNKKVLQTLATNLYDELNDAEIDGVTITVDDVVRSTATDGAYKIWVNIDPADYRDELTLEIISTPDDRGKFICKVYDFNMVSIDQFTIRMSGSKQAVIDKINELVAGINNSQGVESSMKIIRNRITANKCRAVKAAYKEIRPFDYYGYNEDDELAYEGLPYALDSVDEVTAWLKAMLAGVEEFKSEWSEWGGSTSEIEMFSGPSDAEDFGVKMYSDIIQNGLEPLAKELGDLLNVYIYPDDSDY